MSTPTVNRQGMQPFHSNLDSYFQRLRELTLNISKRVEEVPGIRQETLTHLTHLASRLSNPLVKGSLLADAQIQDDRIQPHMTHLVQLCVGEKFPLNAEPGLREEWISTVLKEVKETIDKIRESEGRSPAKKVKSIEGFLGPYGLTLTDLAPYLDEDQEKVQEMLDFLNRSWLSRTEFRPLPLFYHRFVIFLNFAGPKEALDHLKKSVSPQDQTTLKKDLQFFKNIIGDHPEYLHELLEIADTQVANAIRSDLEYIKELIETYPEETGNILEEASSEIREFLKDNGMFFQHLSATLQNEEALRERVLSYATVRVQVEALCQDIFATCPEGGDSGTTAAEHLASKLEGRPEYFQTTVKNNTELFVKLLKERPEDTKELLAIASLAVQLTIRQDEELIKKLILSHPEGFDEILEQASRTVQEEIKRDETFCQHMLANILDNPITAEEFLQAIDPDVASGLRDDADFFREQVEEFQDNNFDGNDALEVASKRVRDQLIVEMGLS